MRLISNCGNTNGVLEDQQNQLTYIEQAIKLNYDVKVDVIIAENQIYFGNKKHIVPIEWIEQHYCRIWFQCTDIETLMHFSTIDDNGTYLNYFYFDFIPTLTSFGYVWSNQNILTNGGIIHLTEKIDFNLSDYIGVCSDFISHYQPKIL